MAAASTPAAGTVSMPSKRPSKRTEMRRSGANPASASSKAAQPPGTTHIALLRGINIGGKNRLAMASLIKLFSDAGCRNVRTHIQSGNILFNAAPRVAAGLSTSIPRAIETAFGLRVPVVIRTAAEFRAAVAGNPFLKGGADPAHLHLVFLADTPERQRSTALDPSRSPGDAFKLVGRELYLCLPNGVSGSRLTNAYLDSTLGTISTGRNWGTVLKLAELLEDGT